MSTPPPPSPRAQAPGDREPRRGLTLFEKLVGVTAAILALVVGGLVLYFPAREVDALRKQLHRKAATYGNLVAAQVASAIAFHDKATAREVFESLSADPDVVGLALFTQAGEVLQQSGLMGDWTAQAGGVTQQRVLNLPERVVSITPVVSLEGPRGTLVLELSLARLQDSRRAVLRSALLAGFAALLFGTGAAWLMARSLTRRLRAI
ncbi:MAG: hypothetical protein JST92_25165, partial [Deltaproteobacteria bacterium]|nr:hypothetical protein [Deltaproteobacteria bacterium]